MCSLRACAVCECEDGEVPASWLARERAPESACDAAAAPPAPAVGGAPDGGCNAADCALEASSLVDRSVEAPLAAALTHARGWRGAGNPWMAEGGTDETYLYINLLANEERYTGYQGEHAQRIWAAIYGALCLEGGGGGGPAAAAAAAAAAGGAAGGGFGAAGGGFGAAAGFGGGGASAPPTFSASAAAAAEAAAQAGACPELRVLYRLVSGMHASISAHLSAAYPLDAEAEAWGPNPQARAARRAAFAGVEERGGPRSPAAGALLFGSPHAPAAAPPTKSERRSSSGGWATRPYGTGWRTCTSRTCLYCARRPAPRRCCAPRSSRRARRRRTPPRPRCCASCWTTPASGAPATCPSTRGGCGGEPRGRPSARASSPPSST